MTRLDFLCIQARNSNVDNSYDDCTIVVGTRMTTATVSLRDLVYREFISGIEVM